MQEGTPFVTLTMFGWLLLGPALFVLLRPRWALLASFAIAWMFLPMALFDWAGLPRYTKHMAIAYAALIGVIACDYRALLNIRPHPADLPMLVWCITPCFSVLFNGPLSDPNAPDVRFWDTQHLGVYDALSILWEHAVTWGVPYLLGRAYLGTRAAHRDACIALLFAGILYIPFCLYELRMSPQLHRLIYGFHPHSDFGQTIRWGGYRPTVFMEHGLMVAFWMATAALAGWQLWASGTLRRVRGISLLWLLIPLTVTAVLCKSLGAILQLTLGLAALWFARRARAPILLVAIALVPPTYITARLAFGWNGGHAYMAVSAISEQRAQSLAFRMDNERILADRAMLRPWFGWAGWNRNRVYDEYGNDISVTDGQWILALGTYGLVGMTALFGWLLIPAVMALWRLQRERDHAEHWPTVAVALIVLMFALDQIPNAMLNPFYVLLVGGLVTFATAPRTQTLTGRAP